MWKSGFRPLSGYLISKLELCRSMEKMTDEQFPSPLGVSYFQIMYWSGIVAETEFPSPLGVSYFQIVLGGKYEIVLD